MAEEMVRIALTEAEKALEADEDRRRKGAKGRSA